LNNSDQFKRFKLMIVRHDTMYHLSCANAAPFVAA
jgi:hypothetical protein